MPDLPEEAVQAAVEALEARAAHVPYFTHRIMARIVLETGGPVLATQTRADERRKVAEEIAAAIEARRCPAERRFCDDCVCRPEDAALAREIGEARDSR